MSNERRPWSREEVAAIVADYFAMLEKELRDEPYNKTEHRRRLARVVDGRSAGSIEFKHANLSAVLIEHGFPYLPGYKPRGNYQQLLAMEVQHRLATDATIHELVAKAADQSPSSHPSRVDWDSLFVPAPAMPSARAVYERPVFVPPHGVHVNYLEREARNRALGEAGEAFVLEVEARRLHRAGVPRLAGRLEHKARTDGDGLGYDILSFEVDGSERYIEVKTTGFGEFTPFFASRNEVETSHELAPQYQLYRLFEFGRKPRIFTLTGDLRTHVALEPVSYRATLL